MKVVIQSGGGRKRIAKSKQEKKTEKVCAAGKHELFAWFFSRVIPY